MSSSGLVTLLLDNYKDADDGAGGDYFRSTLLLQKYKQESKLIRLILSHSSLYTFLIDDPALLLQVLRIKNEIFSYNEDTFFHIPERWKSNRQVALFIAKHQSLSFYYRNVSLLTMFSNDWEIMEGALIEGCFSSNPNEFPLRSNREVMLNVCKVYGYALQYASDELRKDREIVIESMNSSGNGNLLTTYCREEFYSNDKRLIYEAAKFGNFGLYNVPKQLLKDRKFVLTLMKKRPELYFELETDLKHDSKVLKLAVLKKQQVLKFAPPSYQIDRDFVLECVRNFGTELEFAHPSLRKDREIVMESVKSCGKMLSLADVSFKNDRELVLEAIKQDGLALKYASELLKSDRELVMIALNKNGLGLQFASSDLMMDMDVILTALHNNIEAFTLIDPLLRKNKQVLLKFLQKSEWSIHYHFIDEELIEIIKKDRDLFRLAVLSGNENLLDTMELESNFIDDEFMIQAVRSGIKVIPPQFKQTPQIMLEAIKRNASIFKEIEEPLRSNREFVLECVINCGRLLSYINDSLKQDREIVLTAVKENVQQVLLVVPSSFLSDREILLETLKKSPETILHADSNLLVDPNFIAECVKIAPNLHISISDDVRNVILNDELLFLKLVKIYPKIVQYLFWKDCESRICREWLELASTTCCKNCP